MKTVKIKCTARVWSFDCEVQCCTATIAEGVTFEFEITDKEGFVWAPDPRWPEERLYNNFDFEVELEIPAAITVTKGERE